MIGALGQSPFNSASRQLLFANDDGAPVDIKVRVLASRAYESYTFDYSFQAFIDACDGGETFAAGPSAMLDLPFPFTLYGVTSTVAEVGQVGILALGGKHASMSGHNQGLPSAFAPGPAIFPFWDDLGYGISGSAVCHRTTQAHLAGYTVAILDPEPISARLSRFRTSVIGSVRSCWSSRGLTCGSRLRSRAPRRIPVATRLAAARAAAGSSP